MYSSKHKLFSKGFGVGLGRVPKFIKYLDFISLKSFKKFKLFVVDHVCFSMSQISLTQKNKWYIFTKKVQTFIKTISSYIFIKTTVIYISRALFKFYESWEKNVGPEN